MIIYRTASPELEQIIIKKYMRPFFHWKWGPPGPGMCVFEASLTQSH